MKTTKDEIRKIVGCEGCISARCKEYDLECDAMHFSLLTAEYCGKKYDEKLAAYRDEIKKLNETISNMRNCANCEHSTYNGTPDQRCSLNGRLLDWWDCCACWELWSEKGGSND